MVALKESKIDTDEVMNQSEFRAAFMADANHLEMRT